MFHNSTKMYHFLLHKEALVMNKTAWVDFRDGKWQTEIDVRDFIMKNFTPYVGDESFLTAPTQTTSELWDQVMDLTKQERENRSEEHTSELQSRGHLVCRLLL